MPVWIPFAQAHVSDTVKIIDGLARAPISKVVLIAGLITIVRVLVFPVLFRTPVHKRGAGFILCKFANEAADAIAYAAVVVFLLIRPFGIQTFVIPSGSMIDTLRVGDYIVANKLVYRVSEPKRGDIVVFKPPIFARDPGTPDQDFIKRLIGIPGDVIEVRNEKLFRNGHPVDESYWTYTDPRARDESQTVVAKQGWSGLPRGFRAQDFKLVNFKGRLMPLQYDESGANDPIGATRGNDEFALGDPAEMEAAKKLPPAAIPPGQYLFLGDNRNGSSDGRFWGLATRENIVGKAWFTWLPIGRWKILDKPPAESVL